MHVKGHIDIPVAGISMEPTLYDGDMITVCPSERYDVGDILVFSYKNNELLVHRLLKHDEKYYCKGDNSFRLEDICESQIIGKVALVNGVKISPWPEWKINLSYRVNREFFHCRYQHEQAKQSVTYRIYNELVLRKGEGLMHYKKNDRLEYIQADATSLAVFDPETGNTHFFDEVGIDILNILSVSCTLKDLLDSLCAIYKASPEDICLDVEEFLSNAISKNIIESV